MKTRRPFMAPRIPNPEKLTAGKYLDKIENFANFYSKNPVQILKKKHANYICECAKEFVIETLRDNMEKYSEPEIASKRKNLGLILDHLATEAGVRAPKNNYFKFIGNQD